MSLDRPPYYQGCSPETRDIVRQLGIPEKWLEGECIEAIEGIYWINSKFHIATAIAYLWRYKKKPSDNPENDLVKAIWYIDRHYTINLDYYKNNLTATKEIKQILINLENLLNKNRPVKGEI